MANQFVTTGLQPETDENGNGTNSHVPLADIGIVSVIANGVSTSASSGTGETKVFSQLIAGETLRANDTLRMLFAASHGSASVTHTIKVYANTSDAIGGTVIGVYTTSEQSVSFLRNLLFGATDDANIVMVDNTATTLPSDEGISVNSAPTATNIDFGVDQWIVATLTTGSGTSTLLHKSIQILRVAA